METIVYHCQSKPSLQKREEIAHFIHTQLGRFTDEPQDIERCMAYALCETSTIGGKIVTMEENGVLMAVAVVNHTGMTGFIPENIIVYIAVCDRCRNRGVGSRLIRFVMDSTPGDFALHVEPDNPALNWYRRLGFENKYLEMRYKKTERK